MQCLAAAAVRAGRAPWSLSFADSPRPAYRVGAPIARRRQGTATSVPIPVRTTTVLDDAGTEPVQETLRKTNDVVWPRGVHSGRSTVPGQIGRASCRERVCKYV